MHHLQSEAYDVELQRFYLRFGGELHAAHYDKSLWFWRGANEQKLARQINHTEEQTDMIMIYTKVGGLNFWREWIGSGVDETRLSAAITFNLTRILPKDRKSVV